MSREMILAGVMITCPGREAVRQRTLADFREGAGATMPLHIQKDETTFERRQERQEHNSLAALTVGLNRFPEANVLLFLEDDLIFNRHLEHNIQRWAPLRNLVRATPGTPEPGLRPLFFGSLYDPTVRERSACPAQNYFIADPAAVYGSQCFIMSRAMAEYFVTYWWDEPGMQDIKMSRLAARRGPIHYHMPSLVQHVGVVSTWTSDARFHDTKSFDQEFKA